MVCKHGDGECTGNLYQLCVGKHTPPAHNYDWFVQFLVCSWDSGLPSDSKEMLKSCLDKVGGCWLAFGGLQLHCFASSSSKPARSGSLLSDVLLARCPTSPGARPHTPPPHPTHQVGVTGAPRTDIDDCISGPEGPALMRSSAAAVAARSVVNSCTVAIDGRQRCIRDGGQWRDCPGGSADDDFVESLCRAYEGKTGRVPSACGQQGKRVVGSAAATAAVKKP